MGRLGHFVKESFLSERFGPWHLRTWVLWLSLVGLNDLILIPLYVFTPLNDVEYVLRLLGLVASFIPVGSYTVFEALLNPSSIAVVVLSIILAALGDRAYFGTLGRLFAESRIPRIAFNVAWLFALSTVTELLVYGSWESARFFLGGDFPKVLE